MEPWIKVLGWSNGPKILLKSTSLHLPTQSGVPQRGAQGAQVIWLVYKIVTRLMRYKTLTHLRTATHLNGDSSHLAIDNSNFEYATFFHLYGPSSRVCMGFLFGPAPLECAVIEKKKKKIPPGSYWTLLVCNLVGGPHMHLKGSFRPVRTTNWHVKRQMEQMTCSTNAAFKIIRNFHIMMALVVYINFGWWLWRKGFSDMNLLLLKLFFYAPWWLFYNGVSYLPLRNPSPWLSSNPIKSALFSTFNWLITNNYCWNQL